MRAEELSYAPAARNEAIVILKDTTMQNTVTHIAAFLHRCFICSGIFFVWSIIKSSSINDIQGVLPFLSNSSVMGGNPTIFPEELPFEVKFKLMPKNVSEDSSSLSELWFPPFRRQGEIFDIYDKRVPQNYKRNRAISSSSNCNFHDRSYFVFSSVK